MKNARRPHLPWSELIAAGREHASRFWWPVIVPVLLFVVSFCVFYALRSFGASRGDAVGYLLIGKNLADGHVLLKDSIVTTVAPVVDGTEIRAFWPSHYLPVDGSPEILRPKYFLGLPLLLAAGAKLFGETGPFVVMPLAASAALVAMYYAGLALFHDNPRRYIIALLGTSLLLLNPVVFEASVTEPMPALPSTAFLLFSLAALGIGLRKQRPFLIAFAGLLFGFAVNIRETNVIFGLPLALIYIDWLATANSKDEPRTSTTTKLKYAAFFSAGALLTVSISLWSNYIASGNPLVTARSGDAASLSLDNMLNNQGTYKAGHGSLLVYSDLLLSRLVPIPYAGTFAVLAIGLSLRRRPFLGAAAGSWVLLPLLFFSLWINPYDRYLMPALPIACLLIAAGFVQGLDWVTGKLRPSRRAALCMVIGLLTVPAFVPSVSSMADFVDDPTRSGRFIPRADFEALRELGGLDPSGPAALVYAGATVRSRGNIEATSGIRTIANRWVDPENPRTTPLVDPTSMTNALGLLLNQGYHVYLWRDRTTDATQLLEIATRFNLRHSASLLLSYDPPAEIIELTPKRTSTPLRNLVDNGSFELWTPDLKRPIGWNPFGSGLKVSRVQDPHEGDFAVRLETTTSDFGELRLEVADYEALKGSTIVLTGWVRTNSPERVYLILCDGSRCAQSVRAIGDGSYKFLSVAMDVLPDASTLRAHLKIAGGLPMAATFDDVTLIVLDVRQRPKGGSE